MTNKPMLSVEREVIEKALRDALTIRFDTDSHVTKLRALLDKEVDGNSHAPKHQGEPVPLAEIDRNVIGMLKWTSMGCLESGRWPDGTKLYAEQPAPVAVVMPELESALEAWWESDGQYCRAGGGSYEKTFAYRAYEAALAEVARLNGVKP